MEKTLLVQLKIFFMSGICVLKTFNAIMIFGNALFSNCDPWEDLSISRSKGKKATDAVEDMFFMFLRNADTYLKVWMQKIYLEMFYSQTGTLDLSKTGIDKN